MQWRIRLNTSEASNRYLTMSSINLSKSMLCVNPEKIPCSSVFTCDGIKGKSFYGNMQWRIRLNTSEASNRYLTMSSINLSNSYYIPTCCLLLYMHCFHKMIREPKVKECSFKDGHLLRSQSNTLEQCTKCNTMTPATM